MDLLSILKRKFPTDISENIVSSYKDIEKNFALKRWKTSELDGGHFVESVRRLIEHELLGSYTPFTEKLPNFTDSELKKYEQASGDESYRILIPRALKSIYNIRNKRGVGHITGVSPNKMDASYIFSTAKWVLAEVVRLSPGLSINETQEIVDRIVTRQIEILWKDEEKEILRILNPRIRAKDQILILLLDKSPQSEQDLRSAIEYQNSSRFREFLRELHKERLIEYQEEGTCHLSPKGEIEAERLITEKGLTL